MATTFMPIDVVSTTNQVEGNESDIERAPFVPFDGIDFHFEEITRRTASQWAVGVIQPRIAQQACKGLCSKEVRIFEHASIVSATSDNH